MLGAQVMKNCEKYLGLPMVGGKSKVNTFKDLQERIKKKGDGVEGKNYIKGGKGGLDQDGCIGIYPLIL